VCVTSKQPDTKSDPNPNPNPNPNPTTKQHAVVSIQLNVVTCAAYTAKFIRDNVVAPSVILSVVIVTLSTPEEAAGPWTLDHCVAWCACLPPT